MLLFFLLPNLYTRRQSGHAVLKASFQPYFVVAKVNAEDRVVDLYFYLISTECLPTDNMWKQH